MAAAFGKNNEAMSWLVWREEGPPLAAALYRAALPARPFLLLAMVKAAWGLRVDWILGRETVWVVDEEVHTVSF